MVRPAWCEQFAELAYELGAKRLCVGAAAADWHMPFLRRAGGLWAAACEKKRGALCVFAATGAEGLLVFLIFMSSAMLGVPYYALTGTISILLWHVVFCVTGGVYLFARAAQPSTLARRSPCGTSAAALRLTARSLPLVRPVSRRKAMARRAGTGVRPRRCPGAGARRTPHSPLPQATPDVPQPVYQPQAVQGPAQPARRRRRPRLPRSRAQARRGPAQAYGPGAVPAQAPGAPAQPAVPQATPDVPQPVYQPQAVQGPAQPAAPQTPAAAPAPGQGADPQGPAQAYGPGAVPAQAPGAPAQPAAPQTPAAARSRAQACRQGRRMPVQHAPAGGMVCPACGMQGLPGRVVLHGVRRAPCARRAGWLAQGRAQTKEGEPHV